MTATIPCRGTHEHFLVKENSVVFFSLPENELAALSEDEHYEYVELIDDFLFNIDRIKTTLHEHGLNTYHTKTRELIFVAPGKKEKSLFFDTNEYWVAFALFGKGKDPRIYYHIVQDEDILNAIGDYFGIEFSKK